MSRPFFEQAFPLVDHSRADTIRDIIERNTKGENANPAAEPYSIDEDIFIRYDSLGAAHDMRMAGVALSQSEQADVQDFAEKYADLREGENDE